MVDTKNALPSRFEIGTKVAVNFGFAGVVLGFICGINFTESQVNYDIKVFPFEDNEYEQGVFTILKDVRSYYVEGIMDRFKKPVYENGSNGVSNVGLLVCYN